MGRCEKRLTPLGWPRRLQVGFCVYEFWLGYFAGVGLTQPPLNFISGRAKLFDRSTHPTSKLRQLLRAEQKQDNEKDYHHVRPHEIEDTSDRNRHIENLRGICLVRKLCSVQSIHTELAKLYSKKVI